jgi:DNA helicase-2/ATP-dependent DNA helicase PcrA
MATGSAEDIEEERRLLYVAMTRAKDQLDLIVPQRCYVTQQRKNGDRHMYTQRTRFIPEAILDRFTVRLWPPAGAASAASVRGRPRVDLSARMRARWG